MALIFPASYTTAETPIRTGAMSVFPFSEGLQSLYRFKSTYDEAVDGSIRHGNTLSVPRESVPYARRPNDYRREYPSHPIPVLFKPRHEQAKLCQKSLSLLQLGRSHIFQASTGWGKTVAGGVIAAQFGQPTLIVVTKDDLMDQWRHSLINILNIPASCVGCVQADIVDWKGKQFVIGMVQSLIMPDKYPPAFFDAFGLLILDEVHMMAAECFVRVCQTVTAKSRLGFSATPDRKDGKTKLLRWHIGPVAVQGAVLTMAPKVLVRQTGWRIPTRKKLIGNSWQQLPIPYAPGRMTAVTQAMAKTDPRNMEIVNFVLQAYTAGRLVLVMSELREHLDRLFQMLTGEGIPGQEIGYYVGGMSKFDLGLTKKNAHVILGTYKMCATGTDVPQWDTLVLATPRADITQAVGRVLRSVDGKREPIILDLVDYAAIFQGFHLARVKQYYRLGATVVKKG